MELAWKWKGMQLYGTKKWSVCIIFTGLFIAACNIPLSASTIQTVLTLIFPSIGYFNFVIIFYRIRLKFISCQI